MLKKYLILILFFFTSAFSLKAQEGDEMFTIYLVRHAEKDLSTDNYVDPPLTACGEERSEQLSSFLSAVDLDAIYSTNYTRTLDTALPTAKSQGLEIQGYSASDLENFSHSLLDNKQNVLVVGHSYTTSVLAGLLVGETLSEINLDIYNRVYQIVIHNGDVQLQLLHTSFKCED